MILLWPLSIPNNLRSSPITNWWNTSDVNHLCFEIITWPRICIFPFFPTLTYDCKRHRLQIMPVLCNGFQRHKHPNLACEEVINSGRWLPLPSQSLRVPLPPEEGSRGVWPCTPSGGEVSHKAYTWCSQLLLGARTHQKGSNVGRAVVISSIALRLSTKHFRFSHVQQLLFWTPNGCVWKSALWTMVNTSTRANDSPSCDQQTSRPTCRRKLWDLLTTWIRAPHKHH